MGCKGSQVVSLLLLVAVWVLRLEVLVRHVGQKEHLVPLGDLACWLLHLLVDVVEYRSFKKEMKK